MVSSESMWVQVSLNESKCVQLVQVSASESKHVYACMHVLKAQAATNLQTRLFANIGMLRECCTAPTAPRKKMEEWRCIRHLCKKTLPKEHFSLWMKNNQKRNNKQVCNQCLVQDRQEEKEQNVQTNKHCQKHHSETHSKKKWSATKWKHMQVVTILLGRRVSMGNSIRCLNLECLNFCWNISDKVV